MRICDLFVSITLCVEYPNQRKYNDSNEGHKLFTIEQYVLGVNVYITELIFATDQWSETEAQ